MKKLTKNELAYQALNQIASGPLSDSNLAMLKNALNGNVSLLVSRAAQIAGSRKIQDLIPDMISAFQRFIIDGAKTDKQCNAKTAIVNALNDMEYSGDEVYLSGSRYIQMEPAFGGKVDTAVQIRCNCANALARIQHINVYYILSDLLVDPEVAVRAAAAKALAYLGTPESELLLRFRVLTKDKELDVVSECFAGLITMAPKRSLEFVAGYLDPNNPGIAECAALAIGNSHLPRAFELLTSFWDDNFSPSIRQMLLLPIALIRSDDAFNFLLKVLRVADKKLASEAISVMTLYASEENNRKIMETLNAKGDKTLLQQASEAF